MEEQPPPTEAARFFVLIVAIVCYTAGALLFLHASPDYVVGVLILGAIGTIYLGLFMFASTGACQTAALLLTLGGWAWW
jgi:hypothetical protein